MDDEKICSNSIRRAGHMSVFYCPQSRVCTAGREAVWAGPGLAGWLGVFPFSSIL